MVYRTSVSDPFLRLVSFVAVSFVGMVIVFSLIGLMSIWVILPIYAIAMMLLAYLVMRLVSCAMVETELHNDRIRVKWIKHNVINKYPDEDIMFNDVEEDGFVTSNITKEYTLYLKNGREFSYKQFVMYTPSHEDLETMGRDIRARIEQYYTDNPEPWVPDGYKKNKILPETDQEKSARSMRLFISVLSILATYLLVGFPVLKMAFPSYSLLWELKVLGIIITIILLFSKVFGSIQERRQKKLEEAEQDDTNNN